MAKAKRQKNGMGRLFKLHGGKQHPAEWQGKAPFYLALRVNGKRIVQVLTGPDGKAIYDRADAEAARMKIVGAGLAGDRVEAIRETLTVKLATAQAELSEALVQSAAGVRIADAWEAYESTPRTMRPDSGPGTMQQYGFQWGRFEKWITTNHPEAVTLKDVTEDHAAAYASDLQAGGLSGATVNKHIALLRLVFRVLKKQAGLVIDPWEGLRPAKHRPNGRRELTTVELRRVCENATGEMRLLLALGIYTGMRLADCATLRWDAIDAPQGVIMVTPVKTSHTSGKQVRVPIHATLWQMLKDAPAAGVGEYVLPETASTYEGRRDTITDRVQRHFWENGIDCHARGTGQQIERDAAGVPLRDEKGRVRMVATGKRAVVSVGFHSLRHSFVSLCRAGGVSLSVVESLVGHSNPNMTRLYTHTSGGEADRAVKSLPSFTGEPAQVAREALPEWARALVESLTAKNLKAVKSALLKGGAE